MFTRSVSNDPPRIFAAGSSGEVSSEPWPEKRLFDTVARWRPEHGGGHDEVIDAACAALGEGIDSPSLRELAGASPGDSHFDLQRLVERTFEELGIAMPGTLRQGQLIGQGGVVERRPGSDSLRLEVVPAPESVGGFELQVFVNEVEMTSAAAGLGMDPYDVFVPANKLAATQEPHIAPIARCECGVYGCGTTDVQIVRDGDLVHWDWLHETPMNRGVSFPADQYDAEMARLMSSYSWETPDRRAGRLILASVDNAKLARNGLTLSWVSNSHGDSTQFRAALFAGEAYQVLVDVPWDGRSPEELARVVVETLESDPREWTAEWLPTRQGLEDPPRMAGPDWRRWRDPYWPQ